jgi:hypothetical protein
MTAMTFDFSPLIALAVLMPSPAEMDVLLWPELKVS